MSTADLDRLRSIKTLPSLVRYLRDELGWPIASDDFDDITFDYQPEELGLDTKAAVKIRGIKQLRPLDSHQPWGIFFINFEPKRLPVVVLRRILANLVIKSRAGANTADRPHWKLGDLLFISAYGAEDTDQREIAFAHFHQSGQDLPTLRVLGWDGADTPLKLEHVAHTLADKLHWPDDPTKTDAWRTQWSSAFRHRLGHVIRTADNLAEVLADLARRIRAAASRLMQAESDRGSLTKLYKAFQAALIHDLKPDDFADTYAQTITYGLLTAAISRTEMSKGRHGTALIASNVTDMVPITNPFLKEMLQTFLKAGGRKGGIDFDELGIQDVVELLRGDETDLPAILRDFGNRTHGEDPVIHFYEHFLSAYDKQIKIQRGVFYTPQPVVSYIVRSVHELLQTEFGLEDGLASTVTWGEMLKCHPDLKLPPLSDEPGEKRTISPDEPFVQILDPATGTATFLVEAIDVIHRTLTAKWRKQGLTEARQRTAWNDYVPKHLLPRLHGYELMMAPYAIAHMKIGLKLGETGYHFGGEERAHIYLTNALEPKVKQLPQIGFHALAHEAAAVNEVKWYKRFTVVIGNPPYSVSSQNKGDWIKRVIRDYACIDGQPLGERNTKLLLDDYVKFIRFSQWHSEQTGYGIVDLITNHAYLDNPTFRGMRDNLKKAFDDIYVLDLHGNSKKKERCPDGSKDENVFDIQQGVVISTFVRRLRKKKSATVHHEHLWGARDVYEKNTQDKIIVQKGKYRWFQQNDPSSTKWIPLNSQSPFHLFVPQDIALLPEYEHGWKITDVMRVNSTGIKTHRDHFALDFDLPILRERIENFRDLSIADERIADLYALHDTDGWKLEQSRRSLAKDSRYSEHFTHCLYRPFDIRAYYHHEDVVEGMRPEVMSHMLAGRNIGLIATRQVTSLDFCHILCSRMLVEMKTCSHDRGTNLFPLYLYSHGTKTDLFHNSNSVDGFENARPNLAPKFTSDFTARLKMAFVAEGKGNHKRTLGPEDIFHYIYAVLYSPSYRTRYAEFLKIDFPRLPLTSSLELFRALARLGSELVALHLMESPKLDRHFTKVVGNQNPEVEKISWSNDTVWLDKAQTCGFRSVPEAVWNFHIGGYQVCEKWLKDRKGRTLSKDDTAHYHKIVVALSETIRLMQEIDEVIDKHGGWPLK
ncbi:MAG: DNA methyltransferase [Deltaproteobacteria bacterium]|nr:DNA methyltransferase [Deltaproteobacteria bacterium]